MPEFGLAGAEIMCENLTYELIKLGHKVIVVSLYEYHSPITNRMEASGVDIRYINKKPGLDFSIIGKIRKILLQEKPEIIHTHLYVLQYVFFASLMTTVKVRIHTVHNIARKENSFAARKLNYIFFNFFNVIPVALSSIIQDTIEKEYKIKKENIPIVFNGIDLSKCIPKDSYKVNGLFKILHIGRFSEQKNHLGLIKAFSLFHKKYPNSELNLIGDGEKKIEIEKYVMKNNLIDCVHFLGLKSNIYSYLNSADMFTLPSLYEGVPITLIEAMGTGLPIVATSVGGVPDMLENMKDALLTSHDINNICNAFYQYANNESLRKEHGKNAKEKSLQFSIKITAEKYLEIYK